MEILTRLEKYVLEDIVYHVRFTNASGHITA